MHRKLTHYKIKSELNREEAKASTAVEKCEKATNVIHGIITSKQTLQFSPLQNDLGNF